MTGNQEAFQKAISSGHAAVWDQQWEKAIEFYRLAVKEFPDNLAAINSLALALFECERYDESLDLYRRSTQLAPTDPAPLEKMARIYESLGKVTEAVRASQLSAELHLRHRDPDKAIQNLRRALNLQPGNIAARTRLALIFRKLGRSDEAVHELLLTASSTQRSEGSVKATLVVEYALSFDPENKEAKTALETLRSNGSLPAISTAVTSLGPEHRTRMLGLEARPAKEHVTQDPITETRQAALAVLASLLLDPTSDGLTGSLLVKKAVDTAEIQVHLSQAIDAQTKGLTDQTGAELEKSVDAGLNHPAAHFILGLIYRPRQGMKAIEHLKIAVLRPDFALASHLLMGQVFVESGNLTEGADSYLEALCLADLQTIPAEYAASMRSLYDVMIEDYKHQGDTKLQKSLCETVASQVLRPDWQAYLLMVRQQLPGQPAGAPPLPLAEMLLVSSSGKVMAGLTRARSLAAKKDFTASLEEMYFILQFSPDYLLLHEQIGELLAQSGNIEQAVKKMLLTARVYEIRGDTARAIQVLNRTQAISPADLSIRARMIDILTTQGQIEEAIQQYLTLADVHYRMADLEKARDTYLTVLRVAQRAKADRGWMVDILHKIADIDMQRLDWRGAMKIFEQIRNLKPDDMQTRSGLVDINFRLGMDAAAYAEIDAYLEYLKKTGLYHDAASFLMTLICDRPDKIDLRSRLVNLTKAVGGAPQTISELDNLADKSLDSGGKTAAVALLETIVLLNPPNLKDYQKALEKIKTS